MKTIDWLTRDDMPDPDPVITAYICQEALYMDLRVDTT
jgi:hypothetical protein